LKQVLFIAAENDALRSAKVGGVADVVRDLPAALAALNWDVTVIIPSYGLLHTAKGATRTETISVRYRGFVEDVDVWEVPGKYDTVRNLVLDHPLFGANGAGQIYSGDDAMRPFATDANKFALLCAAAATWVETSKRKPDVVHLHDWHAAFYCLLREYSDDHPSLKSIRTVFTIHNLSYQGTRPFADDDSSLDAWFPQLNYEREMIADPVYQDCVNPMLAGIRLADSVSTVSPTYAREICSPSDPDAGFVGGEGLETVLSETADDGRLCGVVNGCYYDVPTRVLKWPDMLAAMQDQVSTWLQQQPHLEAHRIANRTLKSLKNKRPATILLSIGRLVSQKATLFVAATGTGTPALRQIIDSIDDDALLVVLGSGESEYEAVLAEMAAETDKLLYLQGYSESLADPLYALADLFLMPSSFEPCGISQMLAMRASLPCVVHSVGGLKDTVADGETGFGFTGNSLGEQSEAFVATTLKAVALRQEHPGRYQRIREAAGAQRFEWADSAKQTIAKLYAYDND
jgi:starch synthase